jgi:Flp pilus assembly protein TadD
MHYIKGFEAYIHGFYEKAAKEYIEAIKEEPRNPLYHNCLGLALMAMKRYDEAAHEFEEAIKEEPRNQSYHANKCFALIKLGKCEEAKQEAQMAESDPSFSGLSDYVDESCQPRSL